jgi:succinate dehydrogenase / fumarate reductase cytochrome b subunit
MESTELSHTGATKVSNNAGFMQRHHFLLRRLHSLTGIVPIGLFLIVHLTTNSTIAWGGLNSRAEGIGWMDRSVATFQHEVSFINNMPLLLLIEVTLWLAIGFHSILGVYYAMSGANNMGSYKYMGNTRYMVQRLTGYFGIFFLLYHIATLRWGWSWLVPGGAEWSHEFASSTFAAAIQGSTEGFTGWGLLVSAFYFIGVSSLVFHFANGLWSAAITWGLTVSRESQKRWGLACAGLGAGLMAMAWVSVLGFATLDYDRARAVEAGVGHEVPAVIDHEITDATDTEHNDG